MTNETKNVPELRFPEFEREWEERKIGNYIVEIKKYDTQQHSSYSVATSSRRGLFKQAEYFDGNRVFSDKEVLYSVVPPNTITYRHMSDDNIFKFNINSFNESVLVSREYPVFDVNDYADKNFVFYELNNSSNFLKFCIKQKKGGTRTRLYFKVLENYETFYPEKTEQQKIGEFFSKLDRQIELEEQKLEKLEEQKKGYMQKLFSQELRFKDENGNEYSKWEEVKLQNIANIKKGEQIKKENIDNNGKYYHLNGGTTASNRTNLFNTNPFTISISEGGNSCGFIKMNKEYFFSGGHNYTLLDLSVSNYYLYAYLKYHEKNIMSLRVGSGLPNIQKKDISNYLIKIPSKEEQEKIGNFFNELDELIEKQSSKIGVLKQRKKGFLQKMFV